MGYLSCKAESSLPIVNPKARPEAQKPAKVQQFNYQDLQVATSNFSDAKLLGRGSHGLVYKGTLTTGKLVAVKKPSAVHEATEVDNEIEILSTLRSPRLVNLLGFTHDPRQNRLLVVEFMTNGTLYDVLHSNPTPPSWRRRIRLALQAAKAVEILHSLTPPVIHRDIKSANVLIDKDWNARLGDFGLALRWSDGEGRPPAGTIGYLDPCYVTPENLSTKGDVFSFGILLLEIITGRKAIDMNNSPPCVVDWAVPLIRRRRLLSVFDPRVVPPMEASVRKALALLAVRCIRSCRERRPAMEEVVTCLTKVDRMVILRSWNGLTNPCLTARPVGPGSRAAYSNLGSRRSLGELMSNRANDHGKRLSSVNFKSCRFS